MPSPMPRDRVPTDMVGLWSEAKMPSRTQCPHDQSAPPASPLKAQVKDVMEGGYSSTLKYGYHNILVMITRMIIIVSNFKHNFKMMSQ